MEVQDYSGFLAIAVMATFAFALSAAGRHWRRGFSEKSLSWLSALERKATVGRWIFLAIGFCIFIPIIFTRGTKRHLDPWLAIVVVGLIGGIANMFWELSGYAKLEIEVRKRLSSR
jgi:hypothetical protein